MDNQVSFTVVDFSVKAETYKLHDRVPEYKLGGFRQLVFLACCSAHAGPCSVV